MEMQSVLVMTTRKLNAVIFVWKNRSLVAQRILQWGKSVKAKKLT